MASWLRHRFQSPILPALGKCNVMVVPSSRTEFGGLGSALRALEPRAKEKAQQFVVQLP